MKSDCYLPVLLGWCILHQRVLGVLRLLGHPSRWILVVPRLWNFSSEKYSILIKTCNTIHVGNMQLTRYRSLVRRWILVVPPSAVSSMDWSLECAPFAVIPWCVLYATSSITVEYRPFEIIACQCSLSSNNLPTLNCLNFPQDLFYLLLCSK